MNGAKKNQKVKENISVLEALGKYLEVHPFDKSAAVIYGDIRSDLEKRGKTIGAYDLLIAAQALRASENKFYPKRRPDLHQIWTI